MILQSPRLSWSSSGSSSKIDHSGWCLMCLVPMDICCSERLPSSFAVTAIESSRSTFPKIRFTRCASKASPCVSWCWKRFFVETTWTLACSNCMETMRSTLWWTLLLSSSCPFHTKIYWWVQRNFLVIHNWQSSNLFKGISKAQHGLLHSPRMFSSRSHQILVDIGTNSLSLHSWKHLRGIKRSW